MGCATPSPKLMSIAAVAAILTILASTCMANNILADGGTLYTGEYLYIGQYKFIMQDDCNLVLYEYETPVWASNTGGGKSVCRAVLEVKGQLVVYNVNEYPIFRSNYRGDIGNYMLILQEDRNVVIYGPGIWSTSTAKISAGGADVMAMNGTVDGGSVIGPATVNQNVTAIPNAWRTVLKSGEELSAGQSLDTIAFTFIMQDDCNLVLYEYRDVFWASNTVITGNNGCRAVMQADGNFVIYHNGRAIWASHTQRENGNYMLVLQPNRNIVIYGGDVWATGTHIGSAGGAVVKAMNGTVDGGSVIESVTVNQKQVAAIRKVGTVSA